jgi:hypothetical protein
MKTTLHYLFAAVAIFGTLAQAQIDANQASKRESSDKDRLIGAWHLVSMQEPGTDGQLRTISDRTGTLIYTRDGHMSVQIMFPASESKVTNDYVLNGYEASFGRYEVDEGAHTLTHHVEGSITHGLVGKHLTRVYQLSGSQLLIKSARPDEHWSVNWQHD